MIEWRAGSYLTESYSLEKGGFLPKAELAYLVAGELAPDGCNAILVTHGYTTGHHFILPNSLAAEGSWSELVGPGRAIDTRRFMVISSNALGSCYGSSGPSSINPATKQSYGENFPEVTLRDSVRLQYQLLRHLGVKRLHAVAGPSMGGLQALLWGVEFPEFVTRLVVAVSGLNSPKTGVDLGHSLVDQIRDQPGWKGGFTKTNAMVPWLVQRRMEALRTYSMDEFLRRSGVQEDCIEEQLQQLATSWAENFHPWSLVSLAQAIGGFDIDSKLHHIRAKVLLALCANDQLFPASEGATSVSRLRSVGVPTEYFEIPSHFGHLASGLDWRLWDDCLKGFID